MLSYWIAFSSQRFSTLNCCPNEIYCLVHVKYIIVYIDGLVQDCSISSALAMEMLQSCTEPLIYYNDVAWVSLHLISLITLLFVQKPDQANSKNINTLH